MEISLHNLVTSAALITSSSEVEGYPGTNAQWAERPFLPWRTTGITAQRLTFDLGASHVVKLVLLVNANFTSATIQGNATNSWGAPSFSQAITLARNPWTYRYQHGVIVTGFVYRWLSISIPAQTPVDGASYFSLGGVWAGQISTLPRPWRQQVSIQPLSPRVDVGPDHGGWVQRIRLGEPIARFNVKFYSRVDEGVPGYGDQLASWRELERQMDLADFFALVAEVSGRYDPAQVAVLRRMNQPQWDVDLGIAESTWELQEVIGP